jgi:ribosomal protein L7/L12
MSLPEEAKQAASRGDVVEAVKIAREQTGWSLKEAKDAVDAYRHGGGDDLGPRAGAGAPGDGWDPQGSVQIPADAVASLYEGKLIDAIKKTRATTGLGLKDAKEAVERYLASHSSTNARFRAAAAEARGGLVRVVQIAFLVALGVLGYLWLTGRVP